MKLKRKPIRQAIHNAVVIEQAPPRPWFLVDYDRPAATYIWQGDSTEIDYDYYKAKMKRHLRDAALIIVVVGLFPLTAAIIALSAWREKRVYGRLVRRWYEKNLDVEYVCLGRDEDYDMYEHALFTYAWIIKIWRWWGRHRWALDRWMIHRGFMINKEAALFRDAKWAWPIGSGGTLVTWQNQPAIWRTRGGYHRVYRLDDGECIEIWRA